MKKRAILYSRVSTDDQADKGYSLGNQLERLTKYCELQDIIVVSHFKEDHSAKTFDRPEFKKILQFCKSNPRTVDLLLFLNWSRFSRNAGDSYSMISQFNKLGIEPQAIEQPLDLSIPENKMMLAFYLASPEVENDRRSMNVQMGMHKARKEGRCSGIAPKGYMNVRDEQGKAKIVPHPDEAPLIIRCFEEFATGNHNAEEMRRIMWKLGLKISRNMFPRVLKNPMYVGIIVVPAYKDEPEQNVRGLHEPLISIDTFQKVQDVISGRSYNRKSKNTLKEELPLRGFLQCRICGGVMTGSASKGNGGKYYYYHCQKGCTERFKALEANQVFESFLTGMKARPEIVDLYHTILKDVFKKSAKESENELRKIDEEIHKNRTRIQNAQHLLLDGEIPSKEYQGIKARLEDNNDNLIRQKMILGSGNEDFESYLKFSCSLLKNLDRAYMEANLEIKQRIIGSIFPGKLIYEKSNYRTTRVNEVVSLMCLNISELEGKKNGHQNKKFLMPTEVARRGIEPLLPE